MRFCFNCDAALGEEEYLFCISCIKEEEDLDVKMLMVKEWKKNIEIKLLIVQQTINDVQETISRLGEKYGEIYENKENDY